MDDSPRISVVMAVHNGAATVTDAVQSILGQTFADFEIVAIDDGSTDSTSDDLALLAKRDERVTVVRQVRAGLPIAWNAACRHATGEFIARLDPTDTADPARLATQVAFLDAHPDTVAVGSAIGLVDGAGLLVDRADVPADPNAVAFGMLFGPAIFERTALLRREIFEAVGGAELVGTTAGDEALFLRLLDAGRLANLAEPLVNHRRRPLHPVFDAPTRRHLADADAARARFLSRLVGREISSALAAAFRRSQTAMAMFSRGRRMQLGATIREAHAAMESAGMIAPSSVAEALAARLAAVSACKISARRVYRMGCAFTARAVRRAAAWLPVSR